MDSFRISICRAIWARSTNLIEEKRRRKNKRTKKDTPGEWAGAVPSWAAVRWRCARGRAPCRPLFASGGLASQWRLWPGPRRVFPAYRPYAAPDPSVSGGTPSHRGPWAGPELAPPLFNHENKTFLWGRWVRRRSITIFEGSLSFRLLAPFKNLFHDLQPLNNLLWNQSRSL